MQSITSRSNHVDSSRMKTDIFSWIMMGACQDSLFLSEGSLRKTSLHTRNATSRVGRMTQRCFLVVWYRIDLARTLCISFYSKHDPDMMRVWQNRVWILRVFAAKLHPQKASSFKLPWQLQVGRLIVREDSTAHWELDFGISFHFLVPWDLVERSCKVSVDNRWVGRVPLVALYSKPEVKQQKAQVGQIAGENPAQRTESTVASCGNQVRIPIVALHPGGWRHFVRLPVFLLRTLVPVTKNLALETGVWICLTSIPGKGHKCVYPFVWIWALFLGMDLLWSTCLLVFTHAQFCSVTTADPVKNWAVLWNFLSWLADLLARWGAEDNFYCAWKNVNPHVPVFDLSIFKEMRKVKRLKQKKDLVFSLGQNNSCKGYLSWRLMSLFQWLKKILFCCFDDWFLVWLSITPPR